MKFVSIVEELPDFIQAAPLSRVLRRFHREILIHTGQHYEYRLSRMFFDQLQLLEPDISLGPGSGSPSEQIGEMLARLERVLLDIKPDAVIIRGDTESTLVGALAASKVHSPLVHIGAGERSYNKRMPEEIHRLVADRLSDMLFCSTQTAVHHLEEEGIVRGVHFSGDVMLDALLQNLPVARSQSLILQRIGLPPGYYVLATVLRTANTDNPDNLRNIVRAFNAISEPIVFPMHPRTRAAIEHLGLAFASHVLAIEPVNYLDMLMLESSAHAILTDSASVEREAYLLSVPCITLCDETELAETVETGWNRLVGARIDRIIAAARDFIPPSDHPPLFGDGHAAEHIVEVLSSGALEFGQNYDRIAARLSPEPAPILASTVR